MKPIMNEKHRVKKTHSLFKTIKQKLLQNLLKNIANKKQTSNCVQRKKQNNLCNLKFGKELKQPQTEISKRSKWYTKTKQNIKVKYKQ